MIKLVIGGSPCTHWSIAQTNNRETKPEGLGWELFKNYVIGLEKFQPDYFLYENNKSMSPAIKEQISKELGVQPIMIDSALVSAQSRKRLYWTNIPGVTQPADRGILLRDILESGTDLSQNEKAYCLTATYDGAVAWNTLERKQRTMVAELVRVGTIESNTKDEAYDSKQYRVYSPDGKATTLCGQGGGVGAKTGLYATPCGARQNGEEKTIYEVRDGLITIKGKQYPIKLSDGFYTIRKLTVKECMRLQTVPEDYVFPVSNSQAYKMLGNGWTVEVIKHILSFAPRLTAENVRVLSMYDGMSAGMIALKELGANIESYHASEIDKYCIQTVAHNFPEIIQIGDAFQVREKDFKI